MITDDTALLYMNSMLIVSSNDRDADGNYDELKAQIKANIEDIKAKGATKLIIDLRGNGGGYGELSTVIASLFTDEELYSYRDSAQGKPCSIKQIDHYTTAENVWGDGNIMLLVNSSTASAAEVFIHIMKKLPNVTTIGLTNSCGATGGCFPYILHSLTLTFPTLVSLGEQGEFIAEADTSGDMTMPVDIRIPLDDEAYQALFVDEEDYVLNYAIDVLNGKRK